MSNKKLISIILTVIIGFSLIIILPIQIILIHLSAYDTINESYSFIYQPSSPSSIENLYLNGEDVAQRMQLVEQRLREGVKIDQVINSGEFKSFAEALARANPAVEKLIKLYDTLLYLETEKYFTKEVKAIVH